MKNGRIIAISAAVLLSGLIGYAIYKQLAEHYHQDDPVLHDLKKVIEPMFKKEKYWTGVLSMLNERDIMSELKLYRGNKSYTINKDKIFLCLKDENKEYYNRQILLHVLLHEISHKLCPEIGHTENFHEIFEALLEEASKEGIYDPNAYIDPKYCELGDDEI